MALNDDDLVMKYIKYATARNILSRKLKNTGTERLIKMSNMVGSDIHDLKKELHYKNITVTRSESKSALFYGYTVYKNGWRSEHQMLKSIIQTDVDTLLKETAQTVDNNKKK